MLGEQNSVASRFHQYYQGMHLYSILLNLIFYLGLYVLQCLCHSLHLCASKACAELPRNCEELAQNIYAYFSHSAKRKSKFKQYQVITQVLVPVYFNFRTTNLSNTPIKSLKFFLWKYFLSSHFSQSVAVSEQKE